MSGSGAAIWIREPTKPFVQAREHKPDSLQALDLAPGEVRDLGDIRITLSATEK